MYYSIDLLGKLMDWFVYGEKIGLYGLAKLHVTIV